MSSSYPQHSAVTQAPVISHLDYCHRLLNGTRDKHLVTLTSSQLLLNVNPCPKPASGSMLPPHYSERRSSVLSTRLSTICPQAPLQPFVLCYIPAAPASHGCSLKPCALSGSPSLDSHPTLRLREGDPPPGNTPHHALCYQETKHFHPVPPRGIIICLHLAPCPH